MDDAQFWEIIESGGRGALNDPDKQLAAVNKRLLKLTPQEVLGFNQAFNQKLADAYTWDLWGAAYLINGGCSDDGFYYFRAWLISRGRESYEAAVKNPDTLAGQTDPDEDDYEFEALWYAGQTAYEELTGQQVPAATFPWPSKPKGRRWDFDDDKAVARKLPQLAKIYLGDEDE
jgi:hypothetical protein